MKDASAAPALAKWGSFLHFAAMGKIKPDMKPDEMVPVGYRLVPLTVNDQMERELNERGWTVARVNWLGIKGDFAIRREHIFTHRLDDRGLPIKEDA